MATFPQPAYMTVEQYLALDRANPDVRYEYIDGRIIMQAGGSLKHSRIKINVTRVLYDVLRDSPCRVYDADSRVRLSETKYVLPDATVSCDERENEEDDIIRYPRLVVEVLSPHTEARDRGQKFALYRACQSIQEYVLVNTHYPSIEVFRREKYPLWTFHAFGMNDEVMLASLNVRFPVRVVYEDIRFAGDEDNPV
ncbi:MAG: Uma2 family endonuclease [Chloroflexi bacterium]|nr:MAG: Uma2 family endonuclease [Chloroflexota bacterium]